MECAEKKCDGKIELENFTLLRVGCANWSSAFACVSCGRLHWLQYDEAHKTVKPVFNRRDQKIYVIEGELILRD